MTMTMQATPLKFQIRDLTNTIAQITRDHGNYSNAMELEENERPQSAMNLDYHHHQQEAISGNHHGHHSQSSLGKILQPFLQQNEGLSDISQDALRTNLEPVLNALGRLDADLLLDLTPAAYGPKVDGSRCCKSIYDEILPPVAANGANSDSCVRYLHIAEIADQYSIGIFVFAPFSRIPLHDHPEMCVLSRVLYGDLERRSLDLAREGADTPLEHHHGFISECRKSWLGGWFGKDAHSQKLPKGTKRAFKNHVDHLEAPAVTALFPFEGNFHEFVAGPHGAAVLDVLLPPYDNVQNRDCSFYEIQAMASAAPKPSGKEPCYVVPTGQPENFHCISGRYGDLGEDDD